METCANGNIRPALLERLYRVLSNYTVRQVRIGSLADAYSNRHSCVLLLEHNAPRDMDPIECQGEQTHDMVQQRVGSRYQQILDFLVVRVCYAVEVRLRDTDLILVIS